MLLYVLLYTCYFTWAAARSQQLPFVVLAAGLWCLTAGCHVKSPLFPQPPQTEVFSTITMGESIHEKAYAYIQVRPSSFHNPSLSRAVIIKTTSLPISATTFRTALSLYIAHAGRKHKHNPTLSANKHVVQICRSSLSAAVQDCSGERRTSPFNGIERSLSRAVVETTHLRYHVKQRCLCYIAHDGRKHKHNPTLSANKHVVQICRSSLSAAADGLADGSGERRTSLVNGIELKIAQSCRKVVPKSLPVSANTLPTALSFYIAQGRLRKNIRYPSCSQR